MSGIEVAGLVLGAFPIALEVLDRYKEVARRFGFWYRIAAEHKKCDSQIKFHRLVYVNNLKRLLLPLAGLDDTRIDELLKVPGGNAWTEAKITEILRRRLADSYELYLQCMDDFQESLEEMNRELAFDPVTKQHPQESSFTTPQTPQTPQTPHKPRSRAEILKDQGKWQIYRVKFSQAEKERSEIFAKLEACNDRLKTLLQISEDNDQLAQERVSSRTNESNTICRFWSQAGKVFTALSTVWNCSCRAQHSTRLLLEHRTSTTSDFHLLYEKDEKRPQEVRKIRISSNGATLGNSAAIKLSSIKATDSVTTYSPSHRISTPIRSAMKKNTISSKDELGLKPSITVTGVEHTSPSALGTSASTSFTGSPITSLCHSLEVSGNRLCGFLHEDDYRYYVYQEAAFCSDCPKVITLEQLLRKDGAPIPSRRQRIALAFILSSSFLQLLESPWLESSWQKSDVIFFEDPDRPGVFMFDRPHLKNRLERKTESQPPTETGRRLQLSSSLEMLGVVLLELCFGRLLGEQPYRLKYSDTGDSTIKRALDIQAAREWHADIEEEAGYEYSVAVGWCLGGILSTPPDRWREVMLGKVVNSLESCHRHLQQQSV